MPNLPKIDVYHFRYKISVEILMKYYIRALSHFGKLQIIARLKCQEPFSFGF